MNYKIKQIDAIIIIALLVIAAIVMIRADFVKPPIVKETPEIMFLDDDEEKTLTVTEISEDILWKDITITGECDRSGLGKYVVEGDQISSCEGTIELEYQPTEETLGSWTFTPKEELPSTFNLPDERVVTPKDEGEHYKGIIGFREWWHYTIIFDQDSELPGWTLTISFNHMSRLDLFARKPDILFVSLISPDGEKYGGKVEKERPWLGEFGLKDPVLQADSSDNGFRVSFDKSYVQGKEPSWHIHIESSEIDENHDIKIDLQYESTSPPIWTYNKRLVDNSKAKIASYVFLSCDVTGTVDIDGFESEVTGLGNYEHTWASGIVTKYLIKGWDWYHIRCENGWNIYYSNYYLTSQIKSSTNYRINPLGTMLITTDKGRTITLLKDIEIKIEDSEKVSLLVKTPTEMSINAKPGVTQPLLKTYDIVLDLNIEFKDSISEKFGLIDIVGMNIGRSTVSGKITWTDDDGDHDISLTGISSMWTMRH